ncbi:MAG: AtpZ/AtpI family protein [Hyphomicrobiaceae bacterium]|nr:AtpZ/AtpI family protein [Hyphomicrobiaceae bacterium]
MPPEDDKYSSNKAQNPRTEPHEMQQRLDDVQKRIDKMSPNDEKNLPNMKRVGTTRQSSGRALQVGSDLIAGVVVGGLIGYGLDVWFDTKPLWLIVFFMLGIIAGLANVLRSARILQKEQGELVASGELDLGQDLTEPQDDDEKD